MNYPHDLQLLLDSNEWNAAEKFINSMETNSSLEIKECLAWCYSRQEKYNEAGEYIVERELEEEKDNMMREYLEESINLIDTDTAIEYKKCIKSLNNLSKMIKVNKLNSKAFEIAKDLKACLNYEDKIDKIQNAKVGV